MLPAWHVRVTLGLSAKCTVLVQIHPMWVRPSYTVSVTIAAAAAQVPAQLSLVKELMPLIATLPSALARTAALARVWHAVVQADLATRRAVRSGDKAVPGAQLKNVLTEPFVMGIISGTYTGRLLSHLPANSC